MLAGLVQAQEVLAPDPDIRDTIQGQLDAFMEDDFGAAFDLAAPNIQMLFRTPEIFGAMVRKGYPMVWRPGLVDYGDLRVIGGLTWQRVQITDARGRSFVLEYQMMQIAGKWRIAGVQVLPLPGLAV
jgi:hypothetical protein